jgi:hypothetical protein
MSTSQFMDFSCLHCFPYCIGISDCDSTRTVNPLATFPHFLAARYSTGIDGTDTDAHLFMEKIEWDSQASEFHPDVLKKVI